MPMAEVAPFTPWPGDGWPLVTRASLAIFDCRLIDDGIDVGAVQEKFDGLG